MRKINVDLTLGSLFTHLLIELPILLLKSSLTIDVKFTQVDYEVYPFLVTKDPDRRPRMDPLFQLQGSLPS